MSLSSCVTPTLPLQLRGEPQLQAPVHADEQPVPEAARSHGACGGSHRALRPALQTGLWPGRGCCPAKRSPSSCSAEIPDPGVQRGRRHGLQLPWGRVVCGLPVPEGKWAGQGLGRAGHQLQAAQSAARRGWLWRGRGQGWPPASGSRGTEGAAAGPRCRWLAGPGSTLKEVRTKSGAS